jgi:hypothetical protein
VQDVDAPVLKLLFLLLLVSFLQRLQALLPVWLLLRRHTQLVLLRFAELGRASIIFKVPTPSIFRLLVGLLLFQLVVLALLVP